MANFMDKLSRDFNLMLEKNHDILLKFKNFATEAARIRMVSNYLIENTDFLNSNVDFISKNNSRSEIFRKEGNKLFSNKTNMTEAMEEYNKSLCFAEKDSENLGLAYANRSVIYLEWKNYDKCLENIALAKGNNYPTNLLDKINKREINCRFERQKETENSKMEKEVPKLSYEVHKDVPFIAACLELAEDEKFGKFIKTNRDLNPGDIIAIEEPFCVVFGNNAMRFKRCAYCLNDNLYSLIPCENCTLSMFCNQKCYTKALEEFHMLECNVIHDLCFYLSSDFYCALRVVLKLFSNTKELPNLIELLDEIDRKNVNLFTIDHRNSNILEKYQVIHTSITNREKREHMNLILKYIISAVTHIILRKNPSMKKIFETPEYETLYLELIFQNLLTANNLVGCNVLDKVLTSEENILGAYLFSSLLNHSCAPNVSKILYGKKIIVFIIRPIKKGAQLFEMYSFCHYEYTRKDRQKLLKDRFYFTCECEACKGDYPLKTELIVRMPRNVPIINSMTFEAIYVKNPIYGKENIEKYCQILKKYNRQYPCMQLIFLQEALKPCFHNKYKN